MAAMATLTTAKGCWCLGHILFGLYKVGMGVAASKLAKKTEEVVEESLKTYAAQMAERLGLKKEFQLVPHKERGFVIFGSRLLPGEVGLLIPPHQLSENETKFIITNAICLIKSNDCLTVYLIPLVVSVAAAFLFLPTLPLAAYAIGIASGGMSHVALARWATRKNLICALEVSSQEVRESALSIHKKMEKSLRENLPSASLRKWVGIKRNLLLFTSCQERIRLIEASIANHAEATPSQLR